MPVSLRAAADGDRPGIHAVHVAAIRGTCARAYSAEQISSWAGLLSPESYRDVIRKRVMLVATDGEAVVGFGQLNAETGEVDAVYVLPERQGEGIGRSLLSELERQARDRGVTKLELSATLNAADFYEHAGYERQRVAMHRLPTGVELHCIRMGKGLEE